MYFKILFLLMQNVVINAGTESRSSTPRSLTPKSRRIRELEEKNVRLEKEKEEFEKKKEGLEKDKEDILDKAEEKLSLVRDCEKNITKSGPSLFECIIAKLELENEEKAEKARNLGKV